MVKTITRKGDLRPMLEVGFKVYQQKGLLEFYHWFHSDILVHKVKFPLLEFCAREILTAIEKHDQLVLCDHICQNKTIGGNVILGIVMQAWLKEDFDLALQKTTAYIADADDWYVSDIIGERVFGVGLLTQFSATIREMKARRNYPVHWVVRSLGAGSHYAIKKGLEKDKVEKVFLFLLSACQHSNQQIRQGIGWAAKTTAKFHPDIITKYEVEINAPDVPAWFRKKIEIGLNRYRYAQRNRG